MIENNSYLLLLSYENNRATYYYFTNLCLNITITE